MTALPQPIRIVAVGDLSFNGRFGGLVAGGNEDRPLAQVIPHWRAADLRLGNLESPITSAERVVPYKLTLRAPAEAVDVLQRAGFDCLALANNHIMDFGPEGLAETRTRLRLAGIPTVGAGPVESAARAPVIVERQGQKIGLLAYCAVEQKSPLFARHGLAGAACLRIEQCVHEVRELRGQVNWLIVQVHWGEELAQLPAPEQRAWARELVEAGADLVLGHHPHVWQPLEFINGVPVYYSLGNFLFSDMFWRGENPGGDGFVSRFRLHALTRQTGWAEVSLQQGHPAQARFQPARLERDLNVIPESSRTRLREWDRLCRRLSAPDYPAEFRAEAKRAAARRRRVSSWRSLFRRIELWLFRFGLMPRAVEGF